LHDLVSAVGLGTVNVNTASAPVLKALVSRTPGRERNRLARAFRAGALAGWGLTVASATFRIEAVGVAGGMPQPRGRCGAAWRAAEPST
jgi:hypothetical protein